MSSPMQYWDFIVRSVTEHADDKKGRLALGLFARCFPAYKSLSAKNAYCARQLISLERRLVITFATGDQAYWS